METCKDLSKCPHCGEQTLETMENHPWIRHNKKNNQIETTQLFVRKCNNYGCKYEQNDIKSQKEKILDWCEQDNIHEIEETQVEILENDLDICLARIKYYFLKGNYSEVKRNLDRVENKYYSDNILTHIYNHTALIRMICNHYEGNVQLNSKLSAKIDAYLKKYFGNRTFFLLDLLKLLEFDKYNLILGSENYKLIKQRYFYNYIPVNIIGSYLHQNDIDSLEIFGDPEYYFWIYMYQFDYLDIFSILFDVIKKYVDWNQWPNDEVMFCEQICKSIIPTYNNQNGSIDYYKKFKKYTNQLVFDILFYQERYEEAFSYIETDGVDYIRSKGIPYKKNEHMSPVSIDVFQLSYQANDWLGHGWVHGESVIDESTHDGIWKDWVIYLKYLTVVDFYESQLSDIHKKKYYKYIENRIIDLTETLFNGDYKNNILLKEDMDDLETYLKKIEWESRHGPSAVDKWIKRHADNYQSLLKLAQVPKIIPDIYSRHKKWLKALEYYKRAKISDEDKEKYISKYKIHDDLIDELKTLTIDEHKQVHAFTCIIIKLEPKLRNYIRKIFKKNTIEISSAVKNIVDNFWEKKNKNTYLKIRLPDNRDKDELEYLSFHELISIIISKRYFKYFQLDFPNKNEWISLQIELTPIRNNIAHSIPLSDTQYRYATEKVKLILKIIG